MLPRALLALVVCVASIQLTEGRATASTVGVPCSQVIANCTDCDGGGTIICRQCDGGWGVTTSGTCQPCAPLADHCTACKRGACTGCAAGYQLQNGTCTPCTAIDPQCQACSGASCTACPSGYGLTANNTQCQLCSSIDPHCSTCNNGLCTSCASGYGVAPGGGSCQACTTIAPNCLTCATTSGGCTTCGNGYAANLAGQCVAVGTANCSFSVGGQCCQCQYSCLSWNPASGSCVGASSNGCGACQNRQ